ncbi:DUF3887 domain-containing protein [Faecalicoccus pleomorphus]|uniref:DUF3887 domain-containing protein n=1 Tax=Faecalicoccus pleomorphus TaxID=1323 RepID=UPI0025A42E9D|nr:DUF3887 domain-containing protein [Faecalicoccus pleomorphus]MDM8292358.1 DUF3887 domain-containing protein [Faecalicoccus pleomorphus]
MNKEQYVRQVLHHLNTSRLEKKRIQQDLLSDMDAAIEAGESWDEILKRWGPAKEMAKELSENMDLPSKKSHKGLIIGILSGILGVIVIGVVLTHLLAPQQISLKDSQHFDEEVVYQQSQRVIESMNNSDFDTIYDLSNTKMQEVLSTAELKENWESLNPGLFQEISRYYSAEIDSKVQGDYAVCEVLVTYSNQPVTFTISFDTDMKLAGFYMK